MKAYGMIELNDGRCFDLDFDRVEIYDSVLGVSPKWLGAFPVEDLDEELSRLDEQGIYIVGIGRDTEVGDEANLLFTNDDGTTRTFHSAREYVLWKFGTRDEDLLPRDDGTRIDQINTKIDGILAKHGLPRPRCQEDFYNALDDIASKDESDAERLEKLGQMWQRQMKIDGSSKYNDNA